MVATSVKQIPAMQKFSSSSTICVLMKTLQWQVREDILTGLRWQPKQVSPSLAQEIRVQLLSMV